MPIRVGNKEVVGMKRGGVDVPSFYRANFRAFISSTPPVITEQPVGLTVVSGNVANFTASAEGKPNPSVQWQVSSNSGSTWNNISGAVGTTYSFTPSSTNHNYQYRAIFTNIAGTVITNPVVLNFAYGHTITSEPVSLVLQNDGSSFVITASSNSNFDGTGYTALAQWQKSNDGSNWSNVGSPITLTSGNSTVTSPPQTANSAINNHYFRVKFYSTNSSNTGIYANVYSKAAAVKVGKHAIVPVGDSIGVNAFCAGCLMSNGNIYLMPFKTTQAKYFNPTTNTYTNAGNPMNFSNNGGWTPLYGDCIQLNDNRILWLPRATSQMRVFDPSTGDFTPIGPPISGNNYNHAGLTKLNDGRILWCHFANKSYIIEVNGNDATVIRPTVDYINPNYSVPSGYTTFLFARGYAVLPDNKIFVSRGERRDLNPYTSVKQSLPRYFYIIDPSNNTISTGPAIPGTAQVMYHAQAMTDGRIMLEGRNTASLIYDPITDTISNAVTEGTIGYSGLRSYPQYTFAASAVLDEDGRIVSFPENDNKLIIYFPDISEYIETQAGTFNSGFKKGIILPDGRIYYVPMSSTQAKVYGGGATYDINHLLSTNKLTSAKWS